MFPQNQDKTHAGQLSKTGTPGMTQNMIASSSGQYIVDSTLLQEPGMSFAEQYQPDPTVDASVAHPSSVAIRGRSKTRGRGGLRGGSSAKPRGKTGAATMTPMKGKSVDIPSVSKTPTDIGKSTQPESMSVTPASSGKKRKKAQPNGAGENGGRIKRGRPSKKPKDANDNMAQSPSAQYATADQFAPLGITQSEGLSRDFPQYQGSFAPGYQNLTQPDGQQMLAQNSSQSPMSNIRSPVSSQFKFQMQQNQDINSNSSSYHPLMQRTNPQISPAQGMTRQNTINQPFQTLGLGFAQNPFMSAPQPTVGHQDTPDTQILGFENIPRHYPKPQNGPQHAIFGPAGHQSPVSVIPRAVQDGNHFSSPTAPSSSGSPSSGEGLGRARVPSNEGYMFPRAPLGSPSPLGRQDRRMMGTGATNNTLGIASAINFHVEDPEYDSRLQTILNSTDPNMRETQQNVWEQISRLRQ